MSIYYIKTENCPSRRISVFHPTGDIIKFMEDDDNELQAGVLQFCYYQMMISMVKCYILAFSVLDLRVHIIYRYRF